MDHEGITAFAVERHRIYLRRKEGQPRPWTQDILLDHFKFTNIYRELDRTTIWIKENVRDKFEDPYELMSAIGAARWFNRIETVKAMLDGWPQYWSSGETKHLKDAILAQCGDGPYCTGAFIVKAPAGYNKLDGVLVNIKRAAPFFKDVLKDKTLAGAYETLVGAPYLGRFTAAQLVADMKYTPLLKEARDWHLWAHSGPGSNRGLNVVYGKPDWFTWTENNWYEGTRALREKMMPAFQALGWEIPHMQDVQNMLCEYSKYKRGYSRNVFTPTEDK